MKGKLYLCGTPIGNLEDATYRLVRILGSVDLVAAEDTRRSRKLLSHYGIGAKVVSYHEANERKQARHLVSRMVAGDRVALVTDGGMPSISDPGYHLVIGCIEAGVDIEVVPGPSAVVAAVAISGLPTARFCFEGFLPSRRTHRLRRLAELAEDDRTLVLYEAPTRVKETIEDILEAMGDRRVAVAREMTKIHEEVIRGTASEVLATLADEVLGECVIVVEGSTEVTDKLEAAVVAARDLVSSGSTKSRASADAAARFGRTRREIYQALLRDDEAAQVSEKGSQSAED